MKKLPLLVFLFALLSAGIVMLDILRSSHSAPLVQEQRLVPSKTQKVAGLQTQTETVGKVIDGDTFQTAHGKTIRLIGVNAPEQGQPDFQEAQAKLSSLILGKEVNLMTDVLETDQYGRTLAYVYIGSDFVNLDLVSAGLAVSEAVPPDTTHASDFSQAEKNARTQCLGMWTGLCTQSKSACIQLSSIEANPQGKDTQNLNNEWIVITNTCESAQNIHGFLLKDSSASNSYVFKDQVLKSKGNVTLHSGCGTDTETDTYWQCPAKNTAIWNNTGDQAYLFDATGKLISTLQY